jgi:hypothetical protein
MDWLLERAVKALNLPRMASCWTGSLRSRRAFLVAEAMLAVGCDCHSCRVSAALSHVRRRVELGRSP